MCDDDAVLTIQSDDSGVLNDYTNTTRFFSPGLANLYVRLVSSSSYRSSNSWDTYLYAQPTVIDSPGALESVGFLTRDGKKSGMCNSVNIGVMTQVYLGSYRILSIIFPVKIRQILCIHHHMLCIKVKMSCHASYTLQC